MNKKFHEAKGFYIIIAISLLVGLCLNYVGVTPIAALIYTAILYGVTSPILIGIILHISNNKDIMGEYTNTKWTNILGFTAFIIMSVSASAFLYLYLFD